MYSFVKRLRLLLAVVAGFSILATACKKDNEVDNSPQITSFTPASAKGGESILISGLKFSAIAGENTVTINGKPATVTAVNTSGTELTVTVPAKAGSGPITVSVNGKTGASTTNFTYEWVYSVTTLAGDGQIGYADNANGALARFHAPYGITVDMNGNLYVADIGNQRIRKITPAGAVSTLAGDGTFGFKDDPVGVHAQFADPLDVVADVNGNIYVADAGNNRIRKVAPNGGVTTVAGSTAGSSDASHGLDAKLDYPTGIAIDGSGNLYVADLNNQRIRKIAVNTAVTTLAGSTYGYKDDPVGSNAQFWDPVNLTVDGNGNIFVCEYRNRRIRKIAPNGAVTTVAGDGRSLFIDDINGLMASFSTPTNIRIDSNGDLYVFDGTGGSAGSRIRKVAPGNNYATTTFAGSTSGYADHESDPLAAKFGELRGLAIDKDGNMYIADAGNHRIRKIIPR